MPLGVQTALFRDAIYGPRQHVKRPDLPLADRPAHRTMFRNRRVRFVRNDTPPRFDLQGDAR